MKTVTKDAIREARVDELKRLLHKQVCEVMCGWSNICDIKGFSCVPIRKRLKQLKPKQQK